MNNNIIWFWWMILQFLSPGFWTKKSFQSIPEFDLKSKINIIFIFIFSVLKLLLCASFRLCFFIVNFLIQFLRLCKCDFMLFHFVDHFVIMSYKNCVLFYFSLYNLFFAFAIVVGVILQHGISWSWFNILWLSGLSVCCKVIFFSELYHVYMCVCFL